MAKTIELQFSNMEGKSVSISVESPKEGLTQSEISAAMDTILASNVFTSAGGELIGKKGARIVERNVTELELK
ncbi:DUF2922 domain-containing protein [Metabacillus sp. GX 13764]|uniref:DUF2922 domain-containing protein n=1 Tax=Metabacillus kandeliae TaxID=2900151 RepID=UPI001E525C50|nr:DUF2922 domain-containing protein [Metabacillus kandeliae]MCD7036113.1 DUF2922 domain-containing protein [Metabacillus kandeliae]